MFNVPSNIVPQVRAGTIKAYAVAAKNRLAAAPEIPTVDEAGLPGFYESGWWALFAPKGTPKDIIEELNSAGVTALANPEVRQRFAARGRPKGLSLTAAWRRFHRDVLRWTIHGSASDPFCGDRARPVGCGCSVSRGL